MRQRLITQLVTICLLATLTACAVPPATMPAYLALITPELPIGNGTCTGAIIAPREVLTAAHCVEGARRIVTTYGQEARVVGARLSPTDDVAVLLTRDVLFVPEFATLGNPAVGQVAQVFGFCPFYQGHVPRHALYNGLMSVVVDEDGSEIDFGWWTMLPAPGRSNQVCGGDSGGILLQHGKVVGVTSMVDSEFWFVAIGTAVFTVPTDKAREVIGDNSGGE